MKCTLGNPLPFIRNWAKTLGVSFELLKHECNGTSAKIQIIMENNYG
jgi:hypothetical protein